MANPNYDFPEIHSPTPRKENGTLLANVSTINQYIQLFRKECQLPRYQMSHKLIGLIIEYGSKAHRLPWWPTSVFCFKKQIVNYTGGFGTEKTFNFSGKACFCRLERWNQFGLDNRRRLELNLKHYSRAALAGIGARGRRRFCSCIYPSDMAENTVSEITWNIGAPQYTFL